MGSGTLLNIHHGLYATIFFVQMQQKSISASPASVRVATNLSLRSMLALNKDVI